jgi:hypothetical protein
MHAFFRGWKRKVGCVTLMMSCALLGAWIRSYTLADVYGITVADRHHQFCSFHGNLAWCSTNGRWGAFQGWLTGDASKLNSRTYLELDPGDMDVLQVRQWVIVYAWLALPLSLVSAYLILWEPRKQA